MLAVLLAFFRVSHQTGFKDGLHNGVAEKIAVAAVVEVVQPDLTFLCTVKVAVADISLNGIAWLGFQLRQLFHIFVIYRHNFLRDFSELCVLRRNYLVEIRNGKQVVQLKRVEQNVCLNVSVELFGYVMCAGKQSSRLFGNFGVYLGYASLGKILNAYNQLVAVYGIKISKRAVTAVLPRSGYAVFIQKIGKPALLLNHFKRDVAFVF